uniref:Rab-GAP TBC domain-containing protein n=1 Tax=Macrostomum lignano TaxID=282301 RepID=A0A1I8GU85_9PLAT
TDLEELCRNFFDSDLHLSLLEAVEKDLTSGASSSYLASNLGLPLARRRTEKDFNALVSKWNELSVIEKDVSSIRPVYASKDFLEVLVAVRCPNALPEMTDTRWGLIHAPLRCKTIDQLRLDYHDLAISLSQTGVDDECLPDGDVEREKLTVKVLESGSAPLAQELAKRGVPLSYRGRLWSVIFDVSVTGHAEQYLQGLKQAVLDHDLLVDALIFKDVKLTAANNDMYFVFEDYLHMILLMFSRDPAIVGVYRRCCATAPKAYLNGRVGDESAAVAYPPSGVIPFHGFALLLCPLCFLYPDPKELYLVFRELYTRHFYKLHVISSEPDSILGLCALFESLLQTQEPELFHHLRSEGIQPLRIAFRWMMLAFSGLLLPEQVLLLWDRIVAYDSLTILPLFAVGVFSFRKHNLLQTKSFSAAEAVLSDLTTLSCLLFAFMANEENSDYAYSEVYSEPQPLSVLIQQDDFPYLLDLMISLDVTFAQLKHLVWKKLSDLGLIHLMKSRQEYYFEFLDHSYFRRVTEFEESQRLSSFSRFQQTEKAGQESDPLGSIVTLSLSSANPSDLESRLIVEQLTAALCQRQPLCLASPSDPELIEMFHCASQVRRLVDSELQAETAEDRDSFVAWLRTNFPVALSNKLPPALSDSSMMCLSVRRLQQPDGGRLKQPRMSRSNFVDIVVSLGDRPNDILALLRRHPERDTLLRESDHQLIKLCGRMVFMYENRPLWAYKVVQRHIAHHRNNLEIRILEPREVHELHSASGAASTRVLEQLRHGVLQRYIAPRRNAQSCSMMGISPSLKFSVTLSRFNFDSNLLLDSAAVAAAAASAGTGDPAASPGIDEDNQPDYYLYIAPTLSDCSMCMTACLPLQPGSAAADCRNQQFDIAWRDLPRAARLSMAVVERTQHSETPIAWGNMPLFDSHGRLTMGTFSFGLWPVERAPSKQLLQTSGVFNPSGCAQSNSNNPPVALHITLGFELPNYTHYWSTFMPYTVYLSQSSVLQPPMHQSSDSIASYFSCTTAATTDADNFSIATTTTELFDGVSANETGERPATPEQIRNDFLVEDATLAYALAAVETADQDLKLIWKCRNQVATCHPERIVKFCQAIPWRSAEAVDEAYRLLNKWQLDKVALEAGLQLLNSSCLDSRIRSIGVRIVDQKVTVEDDMLCLILMQMVECLKYEAYPDSALARYLLRKAFSNRQIGHHLYYLVKAEMLACDSSQHRLGIFLEAFLLFSPSSLLEYLGNQIGLAVRLSGLASKVLN